MTGTGTEVDPWDLQSALQSTRVGPGDTIWLRGGTYTAPSAGFRLLVNGISGTPVLIKAYPGERPIINGRFSIEGSYIDLTDIEFTYADWTSRSTTQEGSFPTDIPRDMAVAYSGHNIRQYNCIFHNYPIGPGPQGASSDVEFHDCHSFFHGWTAPDRGHGHSAYPQNITGIKLFQNFVSHDTFGLGIHGYCSDTTQIVNIRAVGCTSFRTGSLYGVQYGGILIGGGTMAEAAVIDACMGWECGAFQIGYVGYAGYDHATIRDNYNAGGILKQGDTQVADVESGNDWDGETGIQRVFVRPWAWRTTCATVTIYNYTDANTCVVDLTSVTGLAAGDVVQVRNAQDRWGDVQDLTLSDPAKTITVNMQAINRTVATPVEWTAPATTFPRFGCFIINKHP